MNLSQLNTQWDNFIAVHSRLLLHVSWTDMSLQICLWSTGKVSYKSIQVNKQLKYLGWRKPTSAVFIDSASLIIWRCSKVCCWNETTEVRWRWDPGCHCGHTGVCIQWGCTISSCVLTGCHLFWDIQWGQASSHSARCCCNKVITWYYSVSNFLFRG